MANVLIKLPTAYHVTAPPRATSHVRLILTEYSGGAGDRASRSATLEGALRAAILRIAHGQYDSCRIFDERFGSKSCALTIRPAHRGLSITWANPRWTVQH